jgi:hypothetical protein
VRAALASRPAPAGPLGDTAVFRVRVTSVAYGSDRATYELRRPSYVTIVSVTDSGIVAITPLPEFPARLEGGGAHTRSLYGNAVLVPAVNANGAQQSAANEDMEEYARQEDAYNRCTAAAAARRRSAPPVVIGHDKDGKPIYGTPPESATDQYSPESGCSRLMPSRRDGPARTPGHPVAGRYLMVFASDAPVEYRDIVALGVSESDPQLIAFAIGNKLFGARGAQWAGYVSPW